MRRLESTITHISAEIQTSAVGETKNNSKCPESQLTIQCSICTKRLTIENFNTCLQIMIKKNPGSIVTFLSIPLIILEIFFEVKS
ncbi:hypothetical protein BpHYR1_002624 [Brachionus plicatilis]|uniref:Uncharacterized protein n=1 Tax=Brachionus plicatilis TaxID=10195 RepID=A0A3M7SET6_BRAPC|nr:hypothetical protein BpHYR1_002624 [Brachionus plicatilis]